MYVESGPQIRVRNWKLFFWFLNQNICCGYSKEPSRWDGYFEHLNHMFKLMDKKIIAIKCKLFLLNWPYGSYVVQWIVGWTFVVATSVQTHYKWLSRYDWNIVETNINQGSVRIVALSINSHEKTQQKQSLLFSNIVGSLYFWGICFSRLFLVQAQNNSMKWNY